MNLVKQKQTDIAMLNTSVANTATLVYSQDGKLHEFTENASSLLGYPESDFANLNLNIIITGRKACIKAAYSSLLAGNITTSFRQIVTKNGATVNVEMTEKMLPDGRILAFILNQTDQHKTKKELLNANKELRVLSGHLQNMREQERAHLAREIHDELGQQLTVLKMNIYWLGKSSDAPKEKIKELEKSVDDLIGSIRRVASELRPSLLDNLGLKEAVEWHLEQFEHNFKIKTTFESIIKKEALSDTVKTGLFRIAQEALTNIARYAKAKTVKINLSQKSNEIILSISDDGIGFNKQEIAAKKTLGLLGMKERALAMNGTYNIYSGPGKGTMVVVKIPVSGK